MHFLQKTLYLCFSLSIILQAGGNKHTQTPVTPIMPIVPEIGNFYVGMGVGLFTLENTNTKEELSATTGAFIVGYEIHRHFDVEARYTRSFKDINYKSGNLSSSSRDLDSTFTNFALYAKAGYAFDAFKPYVLLGYGESKITNLSLSDRKEAGFQYGVGLSYKLNPHWELFGDYVRAYDAKGFDGRSRADTLTLDMATFGFNYRF